MDKDKVRQAANAVATLLVLVVNVLANALPINGVTTGEVSDSFAVYFVPAGYVFAIWGLIYLGLIAFAIYQALPSQARDPRLRRIGYAYVLSCLANSAWIFLWHYRLISWTLVAMFVLLASLITIYLRLGIGWGRAPSAELWLVRRHFSVYLGWITVATVANVTAVLYQWGWTGWGISAQAWALVMLLVAAAIGIVVAITRGDTAYLLVLIWAFVGIAVKQSEAVAVAVASLVLALVLVVTLILVHQHRPSLGARASTR